MAHFKLTLFPALSASPDVQGKIDSVRSVKDALRLLKSIENESAKVESPADMLLKELSAGGRFSVTGPRSSKKTIKVTDKVVPLKREELKNIEDSWVVTQRLKDMLDELDSAAMSWNTKFKGMKGSNVLFSTLKKTRIDVAGRLAKAQSVLDKLAQRQIPANIKAFSDSLQRQLAKELEFSDVVRRFYVLPSTKKGSPEFYVYLGLRNLKTQDGGHYPEYQIVLTVLPDMASKGYRVWYTSLRDFVLPRRFARGTMIDEPELGRAQVPMVLRGIRRHLMIDQVFTHFRAAVPTDLRIDKTNPAVHDVVVRDDYIYVVIKRGVAKEKLPVINGQMMDQIETALGLTRRKQLVTKTAQSTKTKRWIIRYSINSLSPEALGYKMTNEKLRELQHVLDLSDKDLTAIRQALKHR